MKRTSSLFSLVLMLSLLLMLTTFVVAGASAPDDGPWVYSVDLPAQAVRFDTSSTTARCTCSAIAPRYRY